MASQNRRIQPEEEVRSIIEKLKAEAEAVQKEGPSANDVAREMGDRIAREAAHLNSRSRQTGFGR